MIRASGVGRSGRLRRPSVRMGMVRPTTSRGKGDGFGFHESGIGMGRVWSSSATTPSTASDEKPYDAREGIDRIRQILLNSKIDVKVKVKKNDSYGDYEKNKNGSNRHSPLHNGHSRPVSHGPSRHGDTNGRTSSHSHNQNGKNNSNGGPNHVIQGPKNDGVSSIDKLREVFMKSIEMDRKRREQELVREQQERERDDERQGRDRDRDHRPNGNEGRVRRYDDRPVRDPRGRPSDRDARGAPSSFPQRKPRAPRPAPLPKTVELPSRGDDMLSLRELGELMRVKVSVLERTCRKLGFGYASSSSLTEEENLPTIDSDTAELVAMELGFEVTRSEESVEERAFRKLSENDASMVGRVVEVETPTPTPTTTTTTTATTTAGLDETTKVEVVTRRRPPVVSLMGHVDHGKTTLMDALRRRSSSSSEPGKVTRKAKKSKKKKGKGAVENDDMAGKEAGGITQAISAFQVPLSLDNDESDDDDDDDIPKVVTFLDTPGHAAFRAMRQNGSHVTDILVLVVAADDGVSAQTLEIVELYHQIRREGGAAAIGLVVAMTKIDRPGVDVEESKRRIEYELMSQDIYANDYQLVPVSGITGEGVDDLVDALALQAQVMDLTEVLDTTLTSDGKAHGEGVVMESRQSVGVGPVVDCIVRSGRVQIGDVVVCGHHWGRVRSLTPTVGKERDVEATASTPVRLTGLKGLPNAGEVLRVVPDEETAQRLVDARKRRDEGVGGHSSSTSTSTSIHLPEAEEPDGGDLQLAGGAARNKKRFQHWKRTDEDKNNKNNNYKDTDDDDDDSDNDIDNGVIRVPVIIKADADGTLQAVRDAMLSLSAPSSNQNHRFVVEPIELGIGPITPNDLSMANESDAAIFMFNLMGKAGVPNPAAVEASGVNVQQHDVIYRLLDGAKDVIAEHYLPKQLETKVHGQAVVQQIFTINQGDERVLGLRVVQGQLYKDKCAQTGSVCTYRVVRDGVPVVTDTKAQSLRRIKDNVTIVKKDEECGLSLKLSHGIQEGDMVECISTKLVRVQL